MEDSLYLRAAQCKPTPRPPIWFMRQAGRYMKSYRDIRAHHSFKEMIKTPDLAAEITLQPIETFGFDAAILFSDILVTAEALGANFDYIEGKGPVFTDPIRSIEQANNIQTNGTEENLQYVFDAIKKIRPLLAPHKIPLIGFAGSPFTVASYWIESQSSPHLKIVKKMMFENPKILEILCDKLCDATITYLNGQIKAGAQALQLFDTWAGLLSWEDFKKYSYTYMKKIIEGIHNPDNLPISVFCKNSGAYLPLLQDTGANIISLDWQSDLRVTRETLGEGIALQGNLDPFVLYGTEEIITKKTNEILTNMKDQNGFIFGLGHGILPDMDPNKVKLIVDLVKSSAN